MGLKRSSTGFACALASLALVACCDDETDPNASGTSSTITTTTTTNTAACPAARFPATYRFDCLDIVEMGDVDGDGRPDGDAIQALLLENTWRADMRDYRLNVLLTVQSRVAGAQGAELVIGSGIGGSDEELCAESSTLSEVQMAAFMPGEGQWQPSGAAGTCSQPATGGCSYGGTYTLDLLPQEIIYIYAQEQDGTVLNCVPGGGMPNAVPLHGIQATITVGGGEDEGLAAGQLTACVLDSEARDLCSCLSDCQGAPFGQCAGCPDGSFPLSTVLAGLGFTDRCTALMGEPAYDIVVGFTAHRIDIDQPLVCGG